MSTPERTYEHTGEGEGHYLGVKSECCGERVWGREIPRGHSGPLCSECGRECEVACEACGVLLDSPDAEHTCEPDEPTAAQLERDSHESGSGNDPQMDRLRDAGKPHD